MGVGRNIARVLDAEVAERATNRRVLTTDERGTSRLVLEAMPRVDEDERADREPVR